MAGFLSLLVGCGERQAVHEYTFLSLGTLVKISIYAADEEKAAAAAGDLEREFGVLNENLYPDRGRLGEINDALIGAGAARMDPTIEHLVARGIELESASGGLFNPALGELVELWGFLQDERPPDLPPPPSDSIATIIDKQPAMARLRTAGFRLESTIPLQLDFGAFAKGYALQRGVEHLQMAGIENALINAGGDISAMGRPGDRAWRIGIRSPAGPAVLGGVELLDGETVVTSGDYERYFEYEGKRFHHILDPRDGYPAMGARSVTVIHRDAVLADAAATALFVAGPEELAETAVALGVRFVLLVDPEHRIHLSPEMRERFVPASGEYPLNLIELP